MTGRPIERRRALQLGALGIAGIAAGGLGLSRTGLPFASSPRSTIAESGLPVVEPAVLRSEAGVLRVELTVARTRLDQAGTATMLTYNGTVPGPTWRVRPGDRLEVRVVNTLDAATNLHFHGLRVSPQGTGDNPFVSIEPGRSFDYRLDVPPDHPPGVFWYHPHRHGSVADQLFGGLYGTILVDGDDAIPVARERVLVISDVSLAPDGSLARVYPQQVMTGREGELLLVNGRPEPRLTARPGDRERWRLVNACTSRYLRLTVDGHRLHLLGVDGGHEPGTPEVGEVPLAPGNRADLVVDIEAGTGRLRTLGYDRGGAMMGMMGGGTELSGPAMLATVVADGPPAADAGPVPQRAVDPDLRGRPIAASREITFTMGMGMGMGAMMGSGPGGAGMNFGFDNRAFDARRTDQSPAAGTIEQWTIRNPTPMDHPFHLHIWPMQIVEEHGGPVEQPRWRDVVNVPAGGRVQVLIDFTRFPGRSVYHCHILDHEDAGMMATVEAR
ncbi:putative multicopper oxidase family protein [Rhodococcus ruber]|uniref:Putative multicopper oxidase family protein n=4 Tax=Rhodococcus ruber TaxID=1830 RepID=A0A098BQY3_9NOCA|nr:putative multicopper oxidase family protein [Rhodococcus ruber]